MADMHVRVADELAEAARQAGGFSEDAPPAAVVRWSMATAAGWPDEACRTAAGPRAQREGSDDG